MQHKNSEVVKAGNKELNAADRNDIVDYRKKIKIK
jgi:hypothetical protein